MNLNERPIASLNRIGGRLCLDFVNTVGGRDFTLSRDHNDYEIVDEKLKDYYDLLAWSQINGLLEENQVEELLVESKCFEDKIKAIVKQAISLREAIYRICKQIINKKTPNDLDLEILNQALLIAYSHIELGFGKGQFFWKWNKFTLDKMLWLIADSAADLFITADLSRLRECGGNGCCWLFEDISKNKQRQWCDMQTCGNLAKVRRFRSRLKKKT